MLAALLITVSLAAPTSLTDHGTRTHRPAVSQKAKATTLAQSSSRVADDPNSPDREIGFVDHYMPFTLSSQALPDVKDNMVISHVLGYFLPCGGLWGPVVLIDGAEFSGDVVISWLLSNIIWFVAIAAVATITVGVGIVGFLAFPYLTTTATLNAVDRGLKAKGYQPPDPKKSPTTTNPNTTPPNTTPDTPPPSYAY